MNAKKTLDLNNWTYALFNGTLPRIITHSTNIGLVLFENPPKRWYRNQTKHILTHSHAIKSKTANSNTEFTTRSKNERHANYETSYEHWTHSWITFDLNIFTIYFFYFTLLVPLSFRWMSETGYLSKISHWLFNWAYRFSFVADNAMRDQRERTVRCVCVVCEKWTVPKFNWTLSFDESMSRCNEHFAQFNYDDLEYQLEDFFNVFYRFIVRRCNTLNNGAIE